MFKILIRGNVVVAELESLEQGEAWKVANLRDEVLAGVDASEFIHTLEALKLCETILLQVPVWLKIRIKEEGHTETESEIEYNGY